MLQEIAAQLENSGIKPSVQRIKIFEYFLQNKNHPSAESIYLELKREVPTLSKATVYNTLGLFLEKGLVQIVASDQYHARYDLVEMKHGHFICLSCKEVYDFPYQYTEKYSGLDEFEIQSEEITIKGICKSCLDNMNNI
jgi:Fur family peroxide stress response transcriptional regulator